MATWSELPLVSIAQNAAYNPQFYVPEIMQYIQESSKIYPFAGQVQRYGARLGDTFSINITQKIGTYTRATTLSAGTKVPLSNIVTKTYYGTVAEMGNGVKMEKFLLNVSPSDIEGRSVRFALGDDIAEMLDCKVRNAVYTATTYKLNGGTYESTSFQAIGTRGHAKFTWEALVRLNTVKMLNNVGDVATPLFIHPYQWEDMILDTTTIKGFTDISRYTERGIQKLYSGEIGEILGNKIIVTNRVVGTKESASTGTLQTAVAFGFKPELAVAFAWTLPTEIRYEDDYDTDFGRTSALAHYGQGGAVKLVDEFNWMVKTDVRADITAYAIG